MMLCASLAWAISELLATGSMFSSLFTLSVAVQLATPRHFLSAVFCAVCKELMDDVDIRQNTSDPWSRILVVHVIFQQKYVHVC